MTLALMGEPWPFENSYERLMAALANHARVMCCTEANAAITFLRNNAPAAVVITDCGLDDPANAAVLAELKSYVKGGGTAVFKPTFTSAFKADALQNIFRDGFDLPWTPGVRFRALFQRFRPAACRLKSSPTYLTPLYTLMSQHLKNVQPIAAPYHPTAYSRAECRIWDPEEVDGNQVPTAWAQVQEGWVGYVGYVDSGEQSETVVLAMCGVLEERLLDYAPDAALLNTVCSGGPGTVWALPRPCWRR